MIELCVSAYAFGLMLGLGQDRILKGTWIKRNSVPPAGHRCFNCLRATPRPQWAPLAEEGLRIIRDRSTNGGCAVLTKTKPTGWNSAAPITEYYAVDLCADCVLALKNCATCGKPLDGDGVLRLNLSGRVFHSRALPNDLPRGPRDLMLADCHTCSGVPRP